MKFCVSSSLDSLSESFRDADIVLISNNWDDYGQRTTFEAYFRQENHDLKLLGSVKICDRERNSSPSFETHSFDCLPDIFMSLGQDDRYYAQIDSLGANFRVEYLTCMRDMAFNLHESIPFYGLNVVKYSLMRFVKDTAIRGQFHRIARGGAARTPYSFDFESNEHFSNINLSFKVNPVSVIPSNIHVLIGRNGVGKTRLLECMAKSFKENGVTSFGQFQPAFPFNNLISVSFSAFDPFTPIKRESENDNYTYIGLKNTPAEFDGLSTLKTSEDFSLEFSNCLMECFDSAVLIERWNQCISFLDSDPILNEETFYELRKVGYMKDLLAREMAREIFLQLSSGHKIVLHTLIHLVRYTEEKTLVLIDEPETHLHPPLLSAFVRALAEFFGLRNAVGIIATHSPVVLQEVPSNCVTIIERMGSETIAVKPEVETFAENVGSLTPSIFGLEVRESGFYSLIKESVFLETNKYWDFDDFVDYFDSKLGGEGLALLRALVEQRRRENRQ